MAEELSLSSASSSKGVDVENKDVTIENKKENKLYRKWAFWYDNQSNTKQYGAAWGDSLEKAFTFHTIEHFWGLYNQIFKPSKLITNADFHLFKAGVEPKWEDPVCANGGKWTVSASRKTVLDSMWLETLMALIGEQFDEAEEICGVVASVRLRGDKLSLWTKNAANEAVQVTMVWKKVLLFFGTMVWKKMSIGRKWKDIIDVTDKINYTSFQDESRRSSKVRYSV